MLGHVSVQTTERYLGCKQKFRGAVNDRNVSNRSGWLLEREANDTCILDYDTVSFSRLVIRGGVQFDTRGAGNSEPDECRSSNISGP